MEKAILYGLNVPLATILGYPLTWFETLGTIFGMLGTVLATKDHIATWFFGILNAILFFIIFYHSALYSDMLLQVYFFITFIYGWVVWSKAKKSTNEILYLTKRQRIKTGIFILVCVAVLSYIVGKLNVWLPSLFPKAVEFKYLDSIVAVVSVTANWLLAKRYIENWILWIIVNLLATYIYFQKDLMLISIEYLIFLILAFYGLKNWIILTNNVGKM